jgi:hypothetical protein
MNGYGNTRKEVLTDNQNVHQDCHQALKNHQLHQAFSLRLISQL